MDIRGYFLYQPPGYPGGPDGSKEAYPQQGDTDFFLENPIRIYLKPGSRGATHEPLLMEHNQFYLNIFKRTISNNHYIAVFFNSMTRSVSNKD